MQSLANVKGSLCKAIDRLKHETAGALGPTLLALPALTEVAMANAKAINELTAFKNLARNWELSVTI
jgi:hypothetical protein